MRDSRSGVRPGSVSRARTNAFQSGIAALHHRIDGDDVRSPRLPLLSQHPPALCRQPIEAALPFARTLDPAPLDPAAVLEPEQRRIERRQRKFQTPTRAGLNQLANLVAV